MSLKFAHLGQLFKAFISDRLRILRARLITNGWHLRCTVIESLRTRPSGTSPSSLTAVAARRSRRLRRLHRGCRGSDPTALITVSTMTQSTSFHPVSNYMSAIDRNRISRDLAHPDLARNRPEHTWIGLYSACSAADVSSLSVIK